MERRVLLAFFLSFLVLFVYQSVFVPPPPDLTGTDISGVPLSPSSTRTNEGVPPTAVPAPPVTAPPTAPILEGANDVVTLAPITTVIGADTEQTVVVESAAVRAVFSNRGAVLTSWELKQHTNQGSDELIDLLPRSLPPDEVQPFTLGFDDPILSARARDALFRPSVTTLALNDRGETLTFEFEDAEGFRIRKVFEFAPAVHDYVLYATVEAALGSQVLTPALQWGPGLGGGESSSSGIGYRSGPRALVFGRIAEEGVLTDEDIQRPEASDVAERPVYNGQIRFAGVDNHYFLAVALVENQGIEVGYRAVPLPPLEPDGASRELMAFELRWPEGDIDAVPFFLGPKNFDALEQVDPALIQAIDFGWLGWLVVPLHRTLTGVHNYIGNWGWSIIILTFLINVVIFPLRHKSVVSMRKMQELQPEMKAIQERYAHLKTADPEKQKMNKEIMDLYKRNKVNPLGGCLPMLLQFPVFIGLYNALRTPIELRHASFLWIPDLSRPDYEALPFTFGDYHLGPSGASNTEGARSSGAKPAARCCRKAR